MHKFLNNDTIYVLKL